MAVGARGRRLGADQQVRRGLPRQAVLRRVRGRRRDRGACALARKGAVRGGARERAAACRRAGKHGGVLRGPEPRRPRPRPVARPRRPPDARAEGQLLREALRVPPLRRLARDDAGRLRRGARARQGGAAEADRVRRLCVPAHGRGRQVPRDRRRGRCAPDVRHGALLRSRRGRDPPEPGAAQRLRHVDEPQDACRAARRLRALQGRARVEARPRELPRDAGRAADARGRRQGRVLRDRRDGRVPRLSAPHQDERRRARRRVDQGRARRADRRHRHAPRSARPPRHRVDGARRAGAARGVQGDREPEHRALRRAAADGRVRRSARYAGGDDARLRRRRLPRGRVDHRRRAARRRRRHGSLDRAVALCDKRPLYPGFRGYTEFRA